MYKNKIYPSMPSTGMLRLNIFVQAYIFKVLIIDLKILYCEDSRGAGGQSVTVKSIGCGFDPHSRR